MWWKSKFQKCWNFNQIFATAEIKKNMVPESAILPWCWWIFCWKRRPSGIHQHSGTSWLEWHPHCQNHWKYINSKGTWNSMKMLWEWDLLKKNTEKPGIPRCECWECLWTWVMYRWCFPHGCLVVLYWALEDRPGMAWWKASGRGSMELNLLDLGGSHTTPQIYLIIHHKKIWNSQKSSRLNSCAIDSPNSVVFLKVHRLKPMILFQAIMLVHQPHPLDSMRWKKRFHPQMALVNVTSSGWK